MATSPSPSRTKASPARRALAGGVMVVGIVALLAGGWLAWRISSPAGAGSLVAAGHDSAQAIESALSEIGETLSEPGVERAAMAVLAGENDERLRRALREAGLANLIDARVFRGPIEEIELASYPEPDYAVAQLLIAARRSGLAPAEVHYPGSADENLAVARSLPAPAGAGTDDTAFLFVRLPVSVVTRSLSSPGEAGWLRLEQDDAEVAAAGSVPAWPEALGRVDVAGSALSLAWGRQGGTVSLPVAIGMAALGVLVMLFGVRLGRAPALPRQAAPPATEKTAQAGAEPTAGKTAAKPEPAPDLPDWMLDEDGDEDGPFADQPRMADRPAPSPPPEEEGSAGFDVPDLDEILEQIESEEAGADDAARPEAGPEGAPEDLEEGADLGGLSLAVDDDDHDESPALEEEQPAAAPGEEEAFDFERALSEEVGAPSEPESETKREEVSDPDSRAGELDLDFAFADAADKEPEAQAAAEQDAEPEVEAVAEPDEEPATTQGDEALGAGDSLPVGIFRHEQVLGTADEDLTAGVAADVGRAIGSLMIERGHRRVAVARDGRVSGPVLLSALTRGLRNAGVDVVEIGAAPTPVLWFAARELADGCGVMVTASHRSAERNGFRVMVGGCLLDAAGMAELARRFEAGDFTEGEGEYRLEDPRDSYVASLASDTRLERPLKVVIDCGNGIAGVVAPKLMEAIGADVIPLYCDVDGGFPNHIPDPASPDELEDLRLCVRNFQADLGIAFDGDGDRIALVSESGEILWPDRLLMLLARGLMIEHPGTAVVFDARCSGRLAGVIEGAGGRPVMTAAGVQAVAAAVQREQALLGGDMNGHLFTEVNGEAVEDALLAAARLVELLAASSRTVGEVMAELPPTTASAEIMVRTEREQTRSLLNRLAHEAAFDQARVTVLDGVRIDWADRWVLARTDPDSGRLLLRFGADDAAALGRVRSQLREQLLALESRLKLPW